MNSRKFIAILVPIVIGLSIASAGLYIAFLTKVLDNLSREFYFQGGLVAFIVCAGSILWLYRLLKLSGMHNPQFSEEKDKK